MSTKLLLINRYYNQMEMDRFWSKVDKTDSCWNWLSGVDKDGYGRFHFEYKTRRAHRFSYELTKGNIPEGYQIDHLCRNHLCVNPDHLEVVTPKENTLRSPIAPASINHNKKYCKRGHGLGGNNKVKRKTRPNGRDCKICHNINGKIHYYKERGVVYQP